MHCHHIPDFYRLSLAEHGILTAGGIPIPAWTPLSAVKFMNDYGIAARVVSISEPGVTYLETAAERKQMAQRINDWTRETLVAATDALIRKRFGGFAVLPLADPNDPVDVANAGRTADQSVSTMTVAWTAGPRRKQIILELKLYCVDAARRVQAVFHQGDP